MHTMRFKVQQCYQGLRWDVNWFHMVLRHVKYVEKHLLLCDSSLSIITDTCSEPIYSSLLLTPVFLIPFVCSALHPLFLVWSHDVPTATHYPAGCPEVKESLSGETVVNGERLD